MIDDAASGEPSLKERIKRRREDRDDETSFLPAEPMGSEAAEYEAGFGGWAVAVSAAVARAQDSPADTAATYDMTADFGSAEAHRELEALRNERRCTAHVARIYLLPLQ